MQISVLKSAFYSFSTGEKSGLYVYIYENHFNPLHPRINLMLTDQYECRQAQTLLSHHTIWLRNDRIYILVVTTTRSLTKMGFTVKLNGPENATLKKMSKYR